jgi:hypothetical protein
MEVRWGPGPGTGLIEGVRRGLGVRFRVCSARRTAAERERG